MTTLLIEPLVTTLQQDISYQLQERSHIAAISPYVYLCNAQNINYTFELLDGVDVIYTKIFTPLEIKTELGTTDNYIHVFWPLTSAIPLLLKNGTYTLKLSADPAYSPTDTSFIGWIKQHEDIQAETIPTPENVIDLPLALRIKIYKQGIA